MPSIIHIMRPNMSVPTLLTRSRSPFLLLGVDTGADGRIEKGNSDTMIVAVVNPKNQENNHGQYPA